jgi:membrane-associated phospholipid phosphatase
MNAWSEIGFAHANELSGRSFTVDALLGLMVDNPVPKAGPIVACFFYAWFTRSSGDDAPSCRGRRRLLLVTLLSVFLLAPVMKLISSDGFGPRPLVRSEQVYALDRHGALRELPRVAYRAPATGDAAARHANLAAGEIDANDFASFPSDHAALFLTLAFGIFLASRKAGTLAIVWAVVCTLGSRVITGLHWPADIAAGGAIGIGLLLALLAVERRLPRRIGDLPLAAADRWPGVSSALVALALLEIANAMNTLERLAELAAAAAGIGSAL